MYLERRLCEDGWAAVSARGLYLAHMGPYCSPVGEQTAWKDRGKVNLCPRPGLRTCSVDQLPFPVRGSGRTVSEVSSVRKNLYAQARPRHHALSTANIQPQGVLDDNPICSRH